ncbi:MAG: DUF3667 domain-containing protein [Woeseiaceae bacterium]|jgi:hypothetical protein
MSSESGPLYEVTIFVAPEVAESCESRIDDYVRKVLQHPAVADCIVFSRDSGDPERLQRVCLHTLSGDDVVAEFVDEPGSEFEGELEAEFGDQIEVHSRILREDQYALHSAEDSPNCLNCGSRLRGQYCGGCGQRSQSRLISLWELVSDAFGDLLELDSRLWQTLVPLLIRPGRLTADYLQGKRARFMPPFRMYLVFSLLFFIVAFFDPRENFSLLFEPEPEPTAEELAQEAAKEQAAHDQAQAKIDELAEKGIIVDDDLEGNLRIDDDGVRFTWDDEADPDEDCEVDVSDMEDWPDWLARRLTPERLERICERTQVDSGKALVDNLLDNIPAALIVLLPLMAFVLKALYPLSKHYYVEHLLFFVHFHAFFFLMLTLQILLMRLSGWVGIPEAIPILIIVGTAFYIAIYLFVAMRRVYGQGRIITFFKYIILLVAYSFGFTMTMLGALAIAAFSIVD